MGFFPIQRLAASKITRLIVAERTVTRKARSARASEEKTNGLDNGQTL